MLNGLESGKYGFMGYASSLYVFAEIAKKYNIKKEFKTAVSWGDKLFDHYKREIKETFSCFFKLHWTPSCKSFDGT